MAPNASATPEESDHSGPLERGQEGLGADTECDRADERHQDENPGRKGALHLARADWRVRRGNLSVAVGQETRMPDVMVEPRGLALRSLVSSEAVLLCEVLSPSSVGPDFKEKREFYFKLASLRAYVVLSQDNSQAWLWQRPGSAADFPAEAERYEGMDAVMRLDHLGVVVSLGEVYGDVVWE